MSADEPTTSKHAAQTPHVFAVRLWKEDLGGGSEYRGSVRDVRTKAFRGFRDWADLVAFMVSRIERAAVEGATDQEGGSDDRR